MIEWGERLERAVEEYGRLEGFPPMLRMDRAFKRAGVRDLIVALQFYADESIYIEGAPHPGGLDGPIPIRLDAGAKARAVLSAVAGVGGQPEEQQDRGATE